MWIVVPFQTFSFPFPFPFSETVSCNPALNQQEIKPKNETLNPENNMKLMPRKNFHVVQRQVHIMEALTGTTQLLTHCLHLPVFLCHDQIKHKEACITSAWYERPGKKASFICYFQELVSDIWCSWRSPHMRVAFWCRWENAQTSKHHMLLCQLQLGTHCQTRNPKHCSCFYNFVSWPLELCQPLLGKHCQTWQFPVAVLWQR